MQNMASAEGNVGNGLHLQMLDKENERPEENKENVEKEHKAQQIPKSENSKKLTDQTLRIRQKIN